MAHTDYVSTPTRFSVVSRCFMIAQCDKISPGIELQIYFVEYSWLIPVAIAGWFRFPYLVIPVFIFG